MPIRKSITNLRFGKLIALNPIPERRQGQIVWECRCDCGNTSLVYSCNLRTGKTKSCGCLRHDKASNLTNQKFGRLLALKPTKERRSTSIVWECLCDCGRRHNATATSLKVGNVKSCGCLIRDIKREERTTHGMSRNPEFKGEYGAWQNMIQRTTNPNHPLYGDYGARGISTCERWKKFENFFADMGKRPSDKHSLDRINVNGNYRPENCRWATLEEQSFNKRSTIKLTAFGETKTLREWARIAGLKWATLYNRLRTLSAEEAISRPLAPWAARRLTNDRIPSPRQSGSRKIQGSRLELTSQLSLFSR